MLCFFHKQEFPIDRLIRSAYAGGQCVAGEVITLQ